MKEVIHTFGDQKNLAGIASIPEKQNAQPVIILLNAGAVHKVGPFDFNIHLSRYLVSKGFLVFRFDLSGLGDSRKIKSALGYRQSVVKDCAEALDVVSMHYQNTKFIVIGLCSGAENAHDIAINDERVVGTVWLDGYGYPTIKFYLLYRLKIHQPINLVQRLFRFITKRLAKSSQSHDLAAVRGENNLDGFGLSLDQNIWTLPDKNQYISNMDALYARGVKCLHLYSGGVNHYYAYKQQFHDAFRTHDFVSCIEVEHYPHADHTYKILSDRQVVIERIADWLEQKF